MEEILSCLIPFILFLFNLSNPLLFSFFLLTYRASPYTAFLAAIKSFDVGQVPFYPLKLCWHQNVTVNQC